MREDDWITEATKDDWMVVEVLMQLRQSKENASLPEKRLVTVFPEWGIRQPRSRQILRCSFVRAKKEGESTRGSPTTPLSWSGGTSFSGSGTVDGYEESSCPVKLLTGVRSKVISTGENAGRRSRKKKTFAELKEEESLLLKERIHLKKELATLRIDFEEQRIWNESLKKMKLQSAIEEAAHVELKEADCDLPYQTEAYSVDHFPSCGVVDAVACPSSVLDSCRIQKEDDAMADKFFALPDLNLPFEDDLNSEVLYGIS